MTRKENIRICDVCKKKVSDDGETWFGGHPHSGWFSLVQTGGSTTLAELKKKREWDTCGVECLRKLAVRTFSILTLALSLTRAAAQPAALQLLWDYPQGVPGDVVFRIYHSPLLQVPLTNWVLLATTTNTTSVIVPRIPGFNNFSATASNEFGGSGFAVVKSIFVTIPPASLRVGAAPAGAVRRLAGRRVQPVLSPRAAAAFVAFRSKQR